MTTELKIKNAEIEKISHIGYFNLAVSIDCVIFGYDGTDLQVLLIKSDLEEFEGLYSLLGDLIRPDEDLEMSSYRILKERTGLDDVFLEQVRTFGSINRHPSGRVITIAYYALIDTKNTNLQLSHNQLKWHPVNKIRRLAFDHKLILELCQEKLRQKIMEIPVVFNLLQEKFSLRQLQEVYESILNVKLDRRNFRKKIVLKDWLRDINEMEKGVSHRPGKLYKLKRKYEENKIVEKNTMLRM